MCCLSFFILIEFFSQRFVNVELNKQYRSYRWQEAQAQLHVHMFRFVRRFLPFYIGKEREKKPDIEKSGDVEGYQFTGEKKVIPQLTSGKICPFFINTETSESKLPFTSSNKFRFASLYFFLNCRLI